MEGLAGIVVFGICALYAVGLSVGAFAVFAITLADRLCHDRHLSQHQPPRADIAAWGALLTLAVTLCWQFYSVAPSFIPGGDDIVASLRIGR